MQDALVSPLHCDGCPARGLKLEPFTASTALPRKLSCASFDAGCGRGMGFPYCAAAT